MPQLHCTVVTPERTALRQSADFVALPLLDGEIGIAPGRGPLVGRIGFGEMRIRSGDQLTRLYLDNGFVQVQGDEVSVLTDLAIPAAELDAETAQEELEEALSRQAYSPEHVELRDQVVARARARLRMAQKRE